MKNAHLRFGWLTYFKRTEKTTTSFKLRVDRFIGEVSADDPRSAKAHLISVIGGDTQIAALNAAISLEETFEIEGPGVKPVRISLGRHAQTYRASLQLPERKRPLRHLVAVSEELMNTNGGTGRTILAGSDALFIWKSVAQIYGIPGMADWADWFGAQLERQKGVVPLLGIGCQPVLIKGSKARFLKWLNLGVRRKFLSFPANAGRTEWPSGSIEQIFSQPQTSSS
jgi:hypothetical protein